MNFLTQHQILASKAVLDAYESEMERWTYLLDENLIQNLIALKMNLSAMESQLLLNQNGQKEICIKMLHIIDSSFENVLQTRVMKSYNAYLKNGFTSAVKQFIRQIDKQQLKVTYFLDIDDKAIDNHKAPILFRIFQEMVINAIIHSEAKNLDITFVTDKKGLSAIIEDNGVGFDLNKSHTKGLGMVNSKSRIAYLNGTLEWSSVKGKGTIVAIYVPLG